MKYNLGDYAKSSYGPEGRIVAYLDQPSYTLENEAGERVCVAADRITDVTPPPALPTAPGYYVGDYRNSPSGKILIELLGTGEWVDNTDSRYLQTEWVQRLGNLTRLVPAEVAS